MNSDGILLLVRQDVDGFNSSAACESLVGTSVLTLIMKASHQLGGDITYAHAIDLLCGKWTVHVLIALLRGPVRLGQLRREIPGASKKGITASLRLLEEMGFVSRFDLSASTLHVEYRINEQLRGVLSELISVLKQIETLLPPNR